MPEANDIRDQVERLLITSKRLREEAERMEQEAEKLKKAIAGDTNLRTTSETTPMDSK